MPLILEKLIAFFSEAKESKSLLEFLENKGKQYTSKNVSSIKGAIKKLSPKQAEEFKNKLGDKLHKHVSKQLKIGNNQSIRVDTPGSSWVQYIEWDNRTSSGKLKTKKSPIVYTLPFFPREIITLVQKGASAGKTIWRKYWRVIGKGSVANKTKNFKAVQNAKLKVKLNNNFRGYTANIKTGKIKRARKTYVRTSNIKGTGAKGIKITIVKPKLKKLKLK